MLFCYDRPSGKLSKLIELKQTMSCLVNEWGKGLTATTQKCCEQYWTSPGGVI